MSLEVNEGLFLFSSSDDDIDESLVSWFNHALGNFRNTIEPPQMATSSQWPPLSGLSLRAGGRGFSPATKGVAPGYFYWKIEEK